jgi:hypothetical protein
LLRVTSEVTNVPTLSLFIFQGENDVYCS